MDKLRKEFEQWFIDKYKQPERLVKTNQGAYKFSGVQMAFSAWKEKSHAEWIDCINEMPQEGVIVLCYEGGDISTLFHRGNGVWDDGDFHSNITGVSHWMPMPNPPGDLLFLRLKTLCAQLPEHAGKKSFLKLAESQRKTMMRSLLKS